MEPSSNFSIEEQFDAAVEIIKNMPKEGPVSTSVDEKLSFYSLFKQATIGPCNQSKPSFYQITEKYKWESWNNLGDLSKEEAMHQYINRLIMKIKQVTAKHNINEWMIGDLYEKLCPLFLKIGMNFSKENGEESHFSDDKPIIEETHTEEADTSSSSDQSHHFVSVSAPLADSAYGSSAHSEVQGTHPESAHSVTAASMSDQEYCDAVDDEEVLSRASSFDVHDNNRDRSRRRSNSLRNYCGRLENELRNISTQIEKLSTAVEQRHNILLSLFKKATVYLFIPKGVSFHTVLFFFLWPFIVHIIIRYFRRFPSFSRFLS